MNSFVELVSAKTGLPYDQTVCIVLLLSGPLFCLPLKRISTPWIRKSYTIAVGLYFHFVIYSYSMIQCLIPTVLSYIFIQKFQRKFPLFVPLFIIGFLALSHIYKVVYNYGFWGMEVTVSLMIFTAKISAIALNYSDGGKPLSLLSDDQKKRKLDKMISFTDYLEYVYFFPACLVGPAFDYYEFKNYLSEQNSQPSAKKQVLKQGVLVIAFAAVYLWSERTFPYDYLISDEYKAKGFLEQNILMIVIFSYLCRYKYYAVWTAADMTLAVCGLSYNGVDEEGQVKWDRVEAARILEIESSYIPRQFISSWNRSIHLWLKKYVYLRVASIEDIKRNPANAIKAEAVAFLTSAFWHGFYPGYYILFIGVLFENLLAKNFEFLQDSLVWWVPRPIRIIVSFFYTLYFTAYFAAGFHLLEVTKAMKFYQIYGYFPIYVMLLLFLASQVTIIVFGKKIKRSKVARRKTD